jgi:hypothetical protein
MCGRSPGPISARFREVTGVGVWVRVRAVSKIFDIEGRGAWCGLAGQILGRNASALPRGGPSGHPHPVRVNTRRIFISRRAVTPPECSPPKKSKSSRASLLRFSKPARRLRAATPPRRLRRISHQTGHAPSAGVRRADGRSSDRGRPCKPTWPARRTRGPKYRKRGDGLSEGILTSRRGLAEYLREGHRRRGNGTPRAAM